MDDDEGSDGMESAASPPKKIARKATSEEPNHDAGPSSIQVQTLRDPPCDRCVRLKKDCRDQVGNSAHQPVCRECKRAKAGCSHFAMKKPEKVDEKVKLVEETEVNSKSEVKTEARAGVKAKTKGSSDPIVDDASDNNDNGVIFVDGHLNLKTKEISDPIVDDASDDDDNGTLPANNKIPDTDFTLPEMTSDYFEKLTKAISVGIAEGIKMATPLIMQTCMTLIDLHGEKQRQMMMQIIADDIRALTEFHQKMFRSDLNLLINRKIGRKSQAADSERKDTGAAGEEDPSESRRTTAGGADERGEYESDDEVSGIVQD